MNSMPYYSLLVNASLTADAVTLSHRDTFDSKRQLPSLKKKHSLLISLCIPSFWICVESDCHRSRESPESSIRLQVFPTDFWRRETPAFSLPLTLYQSHLYPSRSAPGISELCGKVTNVSNFRWITFISSPSYQHGDFACQEYH